MANNNYGWFYDTTSSPTQEMIPQQPAQRSSGIPWHLFMQQGAGGAAQPDWLALLRESKNTLYNAPHQYWSPADAWKQSLWSSVPNSIASRTAAAQGLPHGGDAQGNSFGDNSYLGNPADRSAWFYQNFRTTPTPSMPDPGVPWSNPNLPPVTQIPSALPRSFSFGASAFPSFR